MIKEDELCVCDISLILKMSIASTSHHLRLLYKNEVLDFYKDGKMAYYFIKDDEIREFFSKNQKVLKRVSSCLDTIKISKDITQNDLSEVTYYRIFRDDIIYRSPISQASI